MSTFAVEVKKISKIYPHPNADKLELGQVEGMTYQFVVQKDLYKVGDSVVYFPIDSILPQEFILQQNIQNFLSGKDKNRIKTCKLRNEISQGYVTSASSVKAYLKVDVLPVDLTAALSVTKYEAPEVMTSTGNLVQRPEMVYNYDIEGCDRHPDIVEQLMNERVFISEKIEGTNAAVFIDVDDKMSVCTHGHAIINLPDHEEHTFWQVARNDGLIDAVSNLKVNYFPNCAITIRGEIIGPKVQGNYYNLKKHTIKIFDIEVNSKAIDFGEIDVLLDKIGLRERFVPIIASNVIFKDWLDGRSVQVASNGKSVLIDRLREGIVIKPMIEKYIVGFGRLFLKQRDPVYLDKTGK